MSDKVSFDFLGKNCIIDRSLENLKTFIQALKNSYPSQKLHNPLFLNQIHSNKVVIIDNLDKIYQNPLPKADALVTNIKNLPICIITADCVPIVFYDEINEIMGIAHAGWRGAKAGIIENTVQEMLKLGAKIQNIKVEIGPCIRQESYEVSQEYYDNFIKNNEENAKLFLKSTKKDHFLFNLPKYCLKKLENLGITQIKDQKIDTYKNQKDYSSYRLSFHKTQPDCNRNISFIFCI